MLLPLSFNLTLNVSSTEVQTVTLRVFSYPPFSTLKFHNVLPLFQFSRDKLYFCFVLCYLFCILKNTLLPLLSAQPFLPGI